MNTKTNTECLEDFIHSNPQLERLESLANEFNIFSSLKIVDVEIRHSNFLAWLLDPSETHGLGSYFLKSFLKEIAYKASNSDPSVIEVDSWDLDQAEIRREEEHTDILIVDDSNNLVCVIENKVRSTEHSDQLQKYRERVGHRYPKHRKLLVYLSVEGDIPTDNSYLPLSYSDVIPLIDHLISIKKSTASAEILTFISHYREMVKRYIMKDSDLQEICRKIYAEHKRALDLISEYKPDRLSVIRDVLVDLISNDPDLTLDDVKKGEVRFIAKSLDFFPKEGTWTSSKRILLFDFLNRPEGLDLSLYLGPGNSDLRKSIYDAAQGDLTAFNKAKRKFVTIWFCLYKKNFLKKGQADDFTDDELRATIKKNIDDFKQLDLPQLEKELRKLK